MGLTYFPNGSIGYTQNFLQSLNVAFYNDTFGLNVEQDSVSVTFDGGNSWQTSFQEGGCADVCITEDGNIFATTSTTIVQSTDGLNWEVTFELNDNGYFGSVAMTSR